MDEINRGPWQQTFSGVKFHPLDPRPDEVKLVDIAHALSMQCRFGGHCQKHYSVAEHSLYVAWRVGDLVGMKWKDIHQMPVPTLQKIARVMLAGLLHDASEAYVVDVPRPLKSVLSGYVEIERRVMGAITTCFGLDADAFEHPAIKLADEELLATEARDLMGRPPEPWHFRSDVRAALTFIRPSGLPGDHATSFTLMAMTLLSILTPHPAADPRDLFHELYAANSGAGLRWEPVRNPTWLLWPEQPNVTDPHVSTANT